MNFFFRFLSTSIALTGMSIAFGITLFGMFGITNIPPEKIMLIFEVVVIPMVLVGLAGLIITGQVREDIKRWIKYADHKNQD